MKEMFKFEGVDYSSRVKCAVALLESGRFKNQSEAAKAVGINPATVNANYGETGARAMERRVMYKVIKLGQTGKYSIGAISKKVGMSSSKVTSILKSKSVVLVSTGSKGTGSKGTKSKTKSSKELQQKIHVVEVQVKKAIHNAEVKAKKAIHTAEVQAKDDIHSAEFKAKQSIHKAEIQAKKDLKAAEAIMEHDLIDVINAEITIDPVAAKLAKKDMEKLAIA